MQGRHHQVGSINQRLIKLKQGQKTAFPVPLVGTYCRFGTYCPWWFLRAFVQRQALTLPWTPILIRFLSPYIWLAAVSEPHSSICTHFYSHVYVLCFTPFFCLRFFQYEGNLKICSFTAYNPPPNSAFCSRYKHFTEIHDFFSFGTCKTKSCMV